MAKVIFCTFLLAFSPLVRSQSIPSWKQGTVVLSNQTVLNGEISYHYSHDVIFFRTQGELVVLPAFKIELFRYYDESDNINRQFICLKQDTRSAKVFEIVLQGQVKVLRSAKRGTRASRHEEIEGFDYFSWDGNQLEPIGKFRSRVYPKLLEDQPFEISSFVASSHLNVSEMKSAILIIKEYDRIVQNHQVVARVD